MENQSPPVTKVKSEGSQQPGSVPDTRNQKETEEKCQPRGPMPGIHAPIHQKVRHNQFFRCIPGGPLDAQLQRAQCLSSMSATSAQTLQLPSSSSFQCYGEMRNYVQPYPIPIIRGGPACYLRDWIQDLSSRATTSTLALQPPRRTVEHHRDALEDPQRNDKPVLPDPAGELTVFQLRYPTSSPQGGAVARDHSSKAPAEDALQKRELRLMKNREAARECRRKKKEYVRCLENRVVVLENQNKTLIEELRALKDIYRHKAE